MMPSLGETWIVLASYVFDARLYCDIIKIGDSARTLLAVPVMGQGGGPDRGLFIPPVAAQANATSLASRLDVAINNGAQVVVIYVGADRDSARPWIIGTTGYVQTNGGQAVTSTGQAIPAPSATSVTLMNAGGRVEIDTAGIVALTPATDSPARVELGSNGALQVRRTGAADDHAVLNTPYVDLTNAERAELRALRTQVAALTTEVIAIKASLGILTPTPPFLPVPQILDITQSSAGAAALELSADRVEP